MKEFRVLDLFCGAGGISAGLEKLENFKTLVANDFNEQALKTFCFNHPQAKVIYGDITKQEIKNEIEKLAKKYDVNMIVGGPPCQGFSNKGKKLGLADERNFLFLEYIEMVRRIRPSIFIIENVKNLVSCVGGYFINEIVSTFEEMGYFVEYKVLNALNFGVPQNRERAIIIGSTEFKFDFSDLLNQSYERVNVRDAISDLAYLNSAQGKEISSYENKADSEYQRQRRNSNTLYNHIATKHSKLALEKLAQIPPEGTKEDLPKELWGKQKFKTTWSRLRWDEPSPTIDTRFDTPSNGKNSHPCLNRAITPREAARLQSFDDSYRFLGNKTEICKQIGNAVPPLLSYAIGKSILRQSSFYFKKFNIKDGVIFNADSMLAFAYFAKKGIKFDHIITDPPYSISQKNNFSTMKNAKRVGVDFGEWDWDFNQRAWIKKYSELLKDGGSIIIFCSYKNISFIARELENLGFFVKDFLQWKKTNPMPRNINRRYVQDSEFAIWAVKGKAKWVFNKPADVPYLRSCFITPVVSGPQRTAHPTQKSLKLMSEIIKIHTNKGELILDPFMGSGTTGLACLLNDRKFIGIELSEQYFEIAKNRLSSEDNLLL